MRAFAASFALTMFLPLEGRTGTLLGILEEAYEETVDGARTATNIRLGFQRDPDGWTPLCQSKASPPWDEGCKFSSADNVWTIVHRGTALGQVHTSGWLSNHWNKHAGLLRVASATIPSVGERTQDFAGWPGGDVHRPLLAFSGTVPSHRPWIPVAVTASDKMRVFPYFRKAIPKIDYCKSKKGVEPKVTHVPTLPEYLEVFNALRSNDGAQLIGIRVKRSLHQECDGVGPSASDMWFLVSKGHVRQLKPGVDWRGWSYSTMPIEVADFDGDGNVEALFWFSGYNEDGYILFFDDFKKTARFTWGYH